MTSTADTPPGVQIRGGAGPYEAAVIAALIHRVAEEEKAVRSRKPPSNVASAWVRVGTPEPFGRFVPPVLPDRTGPSD